MLNDQDRKYWLTKEAECPAGMVDLAELGFAVERHVFRLGYTDDPICRVRPGVAQALVQARQHLPAGHQFLVCDGWRSWNIQERLARMVLEKIRAAHPEWTEAQIQAESWTLAPLARVAARYNSHRYGGAVDLTIRGPDGLPLDMGGPVPCLDGTVARLLCYEFREDLKPDEYRFRAHRRVLIQAMEAGGFQPYLPEFWHWEFRNDMSQ